MQTMATKTVPHSNKGSSEEPRNPKDTTRHSRTGKGQKDSRSLNPLKGERQMAKEMGFFPPDTGPSESTPTAEEPVSVSAHEVLALMESGALPEGTRAYLISADIGDPTRRRLSPVEYDCSVLNIQRDLFKHLESSPFPDEFLEQLRTYCDERLTQRGILRAELKEESLRIDERSASGWRAEALELFRETDATLSATIDAGRRLEACPDTVNVMTQAQVFTEELRDMVLRKDCDVYDVMTESLTLVSLFRAALSLEETPPAIAILLKSIIQPVNAASASGGCLCDVEHQETGYESGTPASEGGRPTNWPDGWRAGLVTTLMRIGDLVRDAVALGHPGETYTLLLRQAQRLTGKMIEDASGSVEAPQAEDDIIDLEALLIGALYVSSLPAGMRTLVEAAHELLMESPVYVSAARR